jgi:hypothetical protein
VSVIYRGLTSSVVLLAIGAAGAAEPPTSFDGVWTTVISCTIAPTALPYSYQFASIVKGNVLHGERGVRGTPGWLRIDGRIMPDGSAHIRAHGLVGSERAAIEHRPPGTPYRYLIDARFTGNAATGHRVSGRTCAVSFSRKSP